MAIERGDTILLIGRKTTYFGRAGESIKTGDMVIPTHEVVGREWGFRLTVLGMKYTVVKPSLTDIIPHFRRGPQVILPDCGMRMIQLSGVCHGSRVVEGGTGSGFLTAMLAWAVAPEGEVHTYDVDERAIHLAEENLKMAGLHHLVRWNCSSLDECDIEGADALFLDLSEPWRYWKKGEEILRSGGTFVAYVPTSTQMERIIRSVTDSFTRPQGSEIMVRRWEISKGDEGIRPSFVQPAHLGFVVVARKM